MSCEEVGAYVRLLIYQFNKGAVPINDLEQIKRITGSIADLSFVLCKFPKGKNERMSEVIVKMTEKSKKAAYSAHLKHEGNHANAQRTHSERIANGMLSKDKSKYKDKDKDKKKKRGSGCFAPPSLAEIKSFWEREELKGDYEEFFNHFESNGWKVGGRAPMKSWNHAARNWAKRELKFNPKEAERDETNRRSAEIAEIRRLTEI